MTAVFNVGVLLAVLLLSIVLVGAVTAPSRRRASRLDMYADYHQRVER